MEILIKFHNGKVFHAADYNPAAEEIKLLCETEDQARKNKPVRLVSINDLTAPTEKNVTCKKCLKAWR